MEEFDVIAYAEQILKAENNSLNLAEQALTEGFKIVGIVKQSLTHEEVEYVRHWTILLPEKQIGFVKTAINFLDNGGSLDANEINSLISVIAKLKNDNCHQRSSNIQEADLNSELDILLNQLDKYQKTV